MSLHALFQGHGEAWSGCRSAIKRKVARKQRFVLNEGSHRGGTAAMIANVLIALVALLHVYFMYLEMVAWDTPAGRKAFGLTPEFSAASKALAMNQGLYNGFLVAGLVWGLWLGDAGFAVKVFFLACVLVAGLFGAATVGIKILYVQAIPAALALLALLTGL
jgi:putative membrane protein